MAYGFKLVDDYGVEQFTSTGVLYEHARGFSSFSDQLKTPVYSGSFPTTGSKESLQLAAEPGYWRYWYYQRPYQRYGNSSTYAHNITDSTAGTTYTVGDQGTAVNYWGNHLVVADNTYISGNARVSGSILEAFCYKGISGSQDNTNYFWDLFWKLPSTGIHGINTFYQPFSNPFGTGQDPRGTNGFMLPRLGTGGSHEWVLATTKLPSKSGSYGFECYDETGATIYSSAFTKKPIPVHAYATFTKAEVTDCVQNGTTYNRTLRKSITTPWIGGSMPYSYYRPASTDNLYVANITVSGNTCTLSRVHYTMATLSDWAYTQQSESDFRLVIADGI